MEGGSATGALAVVLASLSSGSEPATIVWPLLLQPASAAAAASVISSGVRVMLAPSRARRWPSRPRSCILSNWDIASSIDAIPGRQQRAAHSNRADGARFRLLAGPARL